MEFSGNRGPIPTRPRTAKHGCPLKFANLLEFKPTDIDLDFQWGDRSIRPAYGTGKSNFASETLRIMLKGVDQKIANALPPEADTPRHVRDLVDTILKRARDGSLTKEHTAVLKSSLELMTGNKK